MMDFVGKAHATNLGYSKPALRLNKRSSENECERVSLKLKSQSFQTTSFLSANPPPLLSGGRGLGRGWLYGLYEFDFI
ncbi:hypothetical protein [Neisseria sicca]|uniref:hypothetical protein n=1 Tax=Neisseria sicca TaxID=490 RepID=UPI00131B7FE1|nr:hypothetical protein [Neisseria sicca]